MRDSATHLHSRNISEELVAFAVLHNVLLRERERERVKGWSLSHRGEHETSWKQHKEPKNKKPICLIVNLNHFHHGSEGGAVACRSEVRRIHLAVELTSEHHVERVERNHGHDVNAL